MLWKECCKQKSDDWLTLPSESAPKRGSRKLMFVLFFLKALLSGWLFSIKQRQVHANLLNSHGSPKFQRISAEMVPPCSRTLQSQPLAHIKRHKLVFLAALTKHSVSGSEEHCFEAKPQQAAKNVTQTLSWKQPNVPGTVHGHLLCQSFKKVA